MRSAALSIAILAACSPHADGPTPTIGSVMPSPICDAQKMISLTISGSGFSPAVIDGLTDHPSVVMPRVVFAGGAGGDVEVPLEGVTLPDTTGTQLVVTVPQGLLEPGSYGLEVI